MENSIHAFLVSSPVITRGEALESPGPVPAVPGVYGWWFDEIPPGVPVKDCVSRDGSTLLYVGISPKAPPRSGARASSQTLRARVRYHYRGNAEGSTLRLTLGVLLAPVIGTELRRVGSGKRRTFSSGERDLSAWMDEHAFVTWLEDPTPWVLEARLIGALDLPLNLDGNSSPFRATLSAMRKQARQKADSLPILPA